MFVILVTANFVFNYEEVFILTHIIASTLN
jgi:hypothetical protein